MTGPDRAFRHTAWYRWPLQRTESRTGSWISFGFLSTNIANKRESTRPNAYKNKVPSRSRFRRRKRRARKPPHKRRSVQSPGVRFKGSDPPQVRPFPGGFRPGRPSRQPELRPKRRSPPEKPSEPAPRCAGKGTTTPPKCRSRSPPKKTRKRPRNAAPAMRRKRLGNAPEMRVPRPGHPRIKNDAVFSNSAPECTPAGTSTGSYRFLTGSECSLRPQKCNFG